MRIASGNEWSPQFMPDMESSDCCSQSGRDVLFQNWFNVKFAGLPGPVGPKGCLGSCFHHYFVFLDDIIESVINNNIWVWDNDNCLPLLTHFYCFLHWMIKLHCPALCFFSRMVNLTPLADLYLPCFAGCAYAENEWCRGECPWPQHPRVTEEEGHSMWYLWSQVKYEIVSPLQCDVFHTTKSQFLTSLSVL